MEQQSYRKLTMLISITSKMWVFSRISLLLIENIITMWELWAEVDFLFDGQLQLMFSDVQAAYWCSFHVIYEKLERDFEGQRGERSFLDPRPPCPSIWFYVPRLFCIFVNNFPMFWIIEKVVNLFILSVVSAYGLNSFLFSFQSHPSNLYFFWPRDEGRGPKSLKIVLVLVLATLLIHDKFVISYENVGQRFNLIDSLLSMIHYFVGFIAIYDS